jgi:4-amino-4-deoxy-L-arabinose transferase-like glycosyltransferase
MPSNRAPETDAVAFLGSRRPNTAIEGHASQAKVLRRLVLIVFGLNLISSVLFMSVVRRRVYDDHFNIKDVHAYATQRLSVATLLRQKNAPGPTSYLWMAATVRLLGGPELLDARIGACLSWVVLVAGILAAARFTSDPGLWYGALLVALVFPHSVEATATVLTEGPALLFAMLGAFVWIEFTVGSEPSPKQWVAGLAGGLCMGVAVSCRQYYIALLPAAALFLLWSWWLQRPRRTARWGNGVILSLAAAAAPVILLMWVWKGLSSPGMVSGASYANITSKVALNISRPLVAAFYCAFYLLPLTFPIMLQIPPRKRWRALLIALLGGLTAAHFSSFLLQPGPLNTVVHTIARAPSGESLLVGLVAAVAIYNGIGMAMLLWARRATLLAQPPFMFALLIIAFFIAEQVGVGGTSPFFDRYVLQVAPFLGLIAFSIFPRLNCSRAAALTAMLAVSQVMLWRFGFVS